MNKRTPVSKIMTKNPISANLTQSLREVATIFEENNIHHLPIVSGTNVIGLISKNDIERISFVSSTDKDGTQIAIYDALSIDQVMTKNVESLEATDTIRDAAEILVKGKFHALPILQDNKLSGILTSTDLIKYLLEQY